MKSVKVIFKNEFDHLNGQTGRVVRSRNCIASVPSWERKEQGWERTLYDLQTHWPTEMRKDTLTWCNNHLSAGPELQPTPIACLCTMVDSSTKTLPVLHSHTNSSSQIEATVSQVGEDSDVCIMKAVVFLIL